MNYLGKLVNYPEHYDASLLQAIPRALQRESLGLVEGHLPFFGLDFLNHYEVSYLLDSGKPVVGILEIAVPADSPFLVESKSLKLYFNSLNQARFNRQTHREAFLALIQKDLNQAYAAEVHLNFQGPEHFAAQSIQTFSGLNLDELNLELPVDFSYLPQAEYLSLEASGELVEETLYSHLLKSNCLITGQPDWASIQIAYTGPKINHESLLRYLISFRRHQEFHEHCIERLFVDVLRHCRPSILSVYGRYTRRGGIDINPFRSTQASTVPNLRQVRQ